MTRRHTTHAHEGPIEAPEEGARRGLRKGQGSRRYESLALDAPKQRGQARRTRS
jgi:hypothetical protein